MIYRTPDKYYFRIHHVRPRFKNNIEDVLFFMATEISKLDEMGKEEFKIALNDAIKLFPGNAIKKQKTIDNWRTEISALFGFIQTDQNKNTCKPSLRARELAEKQDLVENMKKFLYFFQYPGGHVKPHENYKMILNNLNFKPVRFILTLLDFAEKKENKRIAINKAEFTHLIFNDLRCTKGTEETKDTWERLKLNKNNGTIYDWSGDVVRYAGDILDYMVIANLMVTYNGKDYFINSLERSAITNFINSKNYFDYYKEFINNSIVSEEKYIELITNLQDEWFDYVNTPLSESHFETDILAFLSKDIDEYENLKKISDELLHERLDGEGSTTKEIGDCGENLVHGHECMRIKIGGREDLIHLIKLIPTQFAVGYDIQSIEFDERKRYIEVKTTISSKKLHFNRIHLTTNEWRTAETLKDRYFVYRLYLSKEEKKLFIMQDPVGLYKEDKLQMIPKDGADLIFESDKTGSYEELLTWRA